MKSAGLKQEGEWLLEAMVEAVPQLAAEEVLTSFLEKFSLRSLGQKESSLVKALKEVFELSMIADYSLTYHRKEKIAKIFLFG